MANDLGPLFPDDIEAWPHGPVVRDLYIEFHDFERKPITRKARNFDGFAPDAYDADPETQELLNEVWEAYKGVSGTRLSNSTHAPDEPWTVIRDHYGELSLKPRIPNELIKQKFQKKIEPAT